MTHVHVLFFEMNNNIALTFQLFYNSEGGGGVFWLQPNRQLSIFGLLLREAIYFLSDIRLMGEGTGECGGNRHSPCLLTKHESYF